MPILIFLFEAAGRYHIFVRAADARQRALVDGIHTTTLSPPRNTDQFLLHAQPLARP